MPTRWCSVPQLTEIYARWRTFNGEKAVVILGDLLPTGDTEQLASFLQMLQLNDYTVFLCVKDADKGAALELLVPLIRNGSLAPFQFCADDLLINSLRKEACQVQVS